MLVTRKKLFSSGLATIGKLIDKKSFVTALSHTSMLWHCQSHRMEALQDARKRRGSVERTIDLKYLDLETARCPGIRNTTELIWSRVRCRVEIAQYVY